MKISSAKRQPFSSNLKCVKTHWGLNAPYVQKLLSPLRYLRYVPEFWNMLSTNNIYVAKDIKNNAWVTMNNDFFCHEWGDLAMIFMSGEVKKNRYSQWRMYYLFPIRYFMPWTHRSAKNYHQALISPLLPRAVFSDLALWCHYNWSVTSCKREILVLWHHILRLSLHVQTGAKAIFTSE